MTLTTCDHCGEEFPASNLALHRVRCKHSKTRSKAEADTTLSNEKVSAESSAPPLVSNDDSALPTAVPIENPTSESQTWSCAVCTLINQASVTSCEMCGAENASSAMATEMPSSFDEDQSAEIDITVCSVCTYHNANIALSCEMCGNSLNNNASGAPASMADEEDDVRAPDAARRERLVNDDPFSASGFGNGRSNTGTSGGGGNDLFNLMFQGLSNTAVSNDMAEMENAMETQQERRVYQANRVGTSTALGAFAGAMNAVMNDENPLRGALTGGSLGYMGSSIFNEVENMSSARSSVGTSSGSSSTSRTANLQHQSMRSNRNRGGGMHLSFNGRPVFGDGSMNNFPAMLAQVLSQRGMGLDVDNMGYEEMLERFGTGSNTRRAPEQTINALPTHQHVAAKDEKEKRECNICLDTFKGGDCIKTLPCGHSYHDACISKWLENVANCPICKKDI